MNASEDAWLTAAVAAVESSLEQLIDDFREHPFDHRVEHSFHIQLWNLLRRHDVLSQRVQLAGQPYKTQLVHKEWPSNVPVNLTGRGNKTRQRYDIGILDPATVAGTTMAEFVNGDPAAAIVIELGLDYSFDHLKQDFDKLELNDEQHAYVVHFSRRPTSRTGDIQQLIESKSSSGIKTAYVHLDVKNHAFKYKTLGGTEFEDAAYAGS